MKVETDDIRSSASEACNILAALGNEHRLIILCQLVQGEQRVADLLPITGLSQSSLSQHLARLRRDGLVKTRRESQAIFYSLDSPEAARLIETLYDIYCHKTCT
jgi:DNA-binding transcriptional ArsR family regulator